MALRASIVQNVGKQARVTRSPSHSANIKFRPWQIQPFMIAPVLPGESLTRLLLQSRTVTDPLVSPLTGWWLEYYFFYVKHRDLAERDDMASMVLTPGHDMSAYHVAAALDYYHASSTVAPDTINWTKLALRRIVEEFFRDEGESWSGFDIGNLPAASISQQSWLDSVSNQTGIDADDVDVDLDADSTIMASEVEEAMNTWWLQRHQGLTTQSYEEWLRSYGVRIDQKEEPHRPELIRYVRDWTYPTNTIDPTDGTPSSACSWAVTERADKSRFFREPGWIIGVTVARPKVYRTEQIGSAAHYMDDAYSWLPAVLTGEYAHGWKKFNGLTTNSPNPSDGPLDGVTDDYTIDVRDLLLYGDQFVNADPAGLTDVNIVNLPTAALLKRYPDSDDSDAPFAGSAKRVKTDLVCSLTIKTTVQDVSPTAPGGVGG